MALTRKMLKAMGIEDEKIDQIIDAHGETVDALKEQITQYKSDAEKLPIIESELANSKEQINAAGKDAYKEKYESIKAEFETYKSDIANKQTHDAKINAYRAALKAAGIADSRIDGVIKYDSAAKAAEIDGFELTADGKIKNEKDVIDKIKTEWSEFIPTSTTSGANIATPPSKATAKSYTTEEIRGMSAAEINKNWDSIKASLNVKGD